MRKLTITLILIIFSLILSAELVDKIVAKVGTDIILLSDLQKELAQMQRAGYLDENTDVNIDNILYFLGDKGSE